MLKNDLSFVIVKNGEILFESREGGVRKILETVRDHGQKLVNSALADKVVGKAVMLIALKVGFDSIYAKILSKSALDIASKANKSLVFDEVVESILNKDGTDICPFEKSVKFVEDPEIAYNILCKMVFK
ncbi:MAG: DUF1893 domain-containing protein [Nitrososphaeria archaeon]|nr:DUF1893 domain-containing protein [Nitrososphaeria archaeon]